MKRERRVLLAALICVSVGLMLLCLDHNRARSTNSEPMPIHRFERTGRQVLESELSQSARTVVVGLILTAEGHSTLDHHVRLLDHSYLPAKVQLHLAIISPTPVVIRKEAWNRGNCTLFRNLSLVRFREDVCFVLIQDTMDIGPYFLYWVWRIWATRRADGMLIAGDEQGTGLVVHAAMWVRFVRSERVCGNAVARYFRFFIQNVANATVLHPPTIDGYGVARLEWQSLTEREREPKLARVWNERFVCEAVLMRT